MVCQACGKLDTETRSTTDRFQVSNEFSTEIVELLRSNSAPSPCIVSSVSQALLDAEADLKDYKSENLRLQSRIRFINDKRRLLKQHVQKFKSISAPIRKLPTEILAHIFQIRCDSSYTNIGRYTKCGGTPFVLASVCKWWREVAIEHSPLWTRMELCLHRPLGCISDTQQDKMMMRRSATIQLCLARSKVAPLTFLIVGDSQEVSPNLLTNLLLEHADRWHEVTFLSNNMLNTGVLTRPDGNLLSYPMLERLKCSVKSLALFRNSAKLRHLAITQHPSGKDLRDVPWCQITSLDLESEDIRVLDVIDLCPNLEFLSMHLSYRRPAFAFPTKTSYLTEMRVYLGSEILDLQFQLNCLTIPSLTKLTIVSPSDPYARFSLQDPDLERFFQCSGRTITCLRLEKINITCQYLQTLLRTTPSLIELAITDFRYGQLSELPTSGSEFYQERGIGSMFLNMLNVSNHHGALQGHLPPPLQKLERLELEANGCLFDDQAFLDMVISRWTPRSEHAATPSVSCIQFVKVCLFGRELEESVSNTLRSLTREGLQVEFLSLGDDDDNEDDNDDDSDDNSDSSSD